MRVCLLWGWAGRRGPEREAWPRWEGSGPWASVSLCEKGWCWSAAETAGLELIDCPALHTSGDDKGGQSWPPRSPAKPGSPPAPLLSLFSGPGVLTLRSSYLIWLGVQGSCVSSDPWIPSAPRGPRGGGRLLPQPPVTATAGRCVSANKGPRLTAKKLKNKLETPGGISSLSPTLDTRLSFQSCMSSISVFTLSWKTFSNLLVCFNYLIWQGTRTETVFSFVQPFVYHFFRDNIFFFLLLRSVRHNKQFWTLIKCYISI